MENQALREAAKENNVLLWEIAERLHIADGNFSRKLRRELPDEQQKQILGIISDIAAERK